MESNQASSKVENRGAVVLLFSDLTVGRNEVICRLFGMEKSKSHKIRGG